MDKLIEQYTNLIHKLVNNINNLYLHSPLLFKSGIICFVIAFTIYIFHGLLYGFNKNINEANTTSLMFKFISCIGLALILTGLVF